MTRRILWFAAAALTVATFMWQDSTGPTSPLDGEFATPSGPVRFLFSRSETIGTPLPLVLLDPVPQNLTGRVDYRRYSSHDRWTSVPMQRGTFTFTRRGTAASVRGVGALLPSLAERAGKYEIFVRMNAGGPQLLSVTGAQPFYARFKAGVPHWALVAHILAIFTSLLFAIRTTLEAVIDGDFRWLITATIVSLLIGAFALGPLAQWYAFGVWWAGIPFGYDWTDNKVLVSLAGWAFAAFANRGGRRSRQAVYAAGVITLLVYFIPHSVFGSEFDYRTGTGRGTVG